MRELLLKSAVYIVLVFCSPKTCLNYFKKLFLGKFYKNSLILGNAEKVKTIFTHEIEQYENGKDFLSLHCFGFRQETNMTNAG